MLMQHVRKIGGTRIARSADREAVMGGLYLVRSDVREAKTDAGHEGSWLCGCGAAAWKRRARARRGGWAIHTKPRRFGELRKAEEEKILVF